jgi:hypothetical protein|tara:strand:+ start:1314 stop:1511 length:198 start_codon:yes stop_codon:yes gene_type:complete
MTKEFANLGLDGCDFSAIADLMYVVDTCWRYWRMHRRSEELARIRALRASVLMWTELKLLLRPPL